MRGMPHERPPRRGMIGCYDHPRIHQASIFENGPDFSASKCGVRSDSAPLAELLLELVLGLGFRATTVCCFGFCRLVVLPTRCNRLPAMQDMAGLPGCGRLYWKTCPPLPQVPHQAGRTNSPVDLGASRPLLGHRSAAIRLRITNGSGGGTKIDLTLARGIPGTTTIRAEIYV